MSVVQPTNVFYASQYQVYSPNHYIQGDGSTDDTANLNKLIALAQLSNGTVVLDGGYSTKGIFLISDSLLVQNSPVTIVGLAHLHGDLVYGTSPAYLPTITAVNPNFPIFMLSGVTNGVELSNFQVDITGGLSTSFLLTVQAPTPGPKNLVVMLSNCVEVRISHLKVTGAYNGFQIASAMNAASRNILIEDVNYVPAELKATGRYGFSVCGRVRERMYNPFLHRRSDVQHNSAYGRRLCLRRSMEHIVA